VFFREEESSDIIHAAVNESHGKVDGNFFNKFEDDFDESDMKPAV